MSVDDLGQYLKESWLAIKKQLLEGSYQPRAVRRVRIPKPTGKDKRELGIPCVADRFIQQAMLQVLQRKWDKRFSDYSYGFRPARRAHHAIAQAQSYLKQGHEWVCGEGCKVINFSFSRVGSETTRSVGPRYSVARKARVEGISALLQ